MSRGPICIVEGAHAHAEPTSAWNSSVTSSSSSSSSCLLFFSQHHCYQVFSFFLAGQQQEWWRHSSVARPTIERCCSLYTWGHHTLFSQWKWHPLIPSYMDRQVVVFQQQQQEASIILSESVPYPRTLLPHGIAILQTSLRLTMWISFILKMKYKSLGSFMVGYVISCNDTFQRCHPGVSE